MGIACETSPWCLGLGPSYWFGDMVEWNVQSLVLTPPSPHFPAGSVRVGSAWANWETALA